MRFQHVLGHGAWCNVSIRRLSSHSSVEKHSWCLLSPCPACWQLSNNDMIARCCSYVLLSVISCVLCCIALLLLYHVLTTLEQGSHAGLHVDVDDSRRRRDAGPDPVGLGGVSGWGETCFSVSVFWLVLFIAYVFQWMERVATLWKSAPVS